MRIFVSWSGKTSHAIALVLRDWLPTVIPTVELWVSSEDIDKGERWNVELAEQLELCFCGIICVDSSNVNSPWLNFEAGALSKSVRNGRIFPLLYGVVPSDLKGPLTQFQVTTFDIDDFLKFSHTINKIVGEPISAGKVEKTVKYSWPGLQNRITAVVPSISGEILGLENEEKEDESTVFSDDENNILRLVSDSHRISKVGRDYLMWTEILEESRIQRHKLQYLLSRLVHHKLVKVDSDGIRFSITDLGTLYLIQRKIL